MALVNGDAEGGHLKLTEGSTGSLGGVHDDVRLWEPLGVLKAGR